VIFALMAAMNIFLAQRAADGSLDLSGPEYAARGDSHKIVVAFLRGAFENALIASLCIVSWHLMRRPVRHRLSLGASLVSAALAITSMRWLYDRVMHGAYPGYWVEPIFVWPCLLYAIIYAYRESRKASTLNGKPASFGIQL